MLCADDPEIALCIFKKCLLSLAVAAVLASHFLLCPKIWPN